PRDVDTEGRGVVPRREGIVGTEPDVIALATVGAYDPTVLVLAGVDRQIRRIVDPGTGFGLGDTTHRAVVTTLEHLNTILVFDQSVLVAEAVAIGLLDGSRPRGVGVKLGIDQDIFRFHGTVSPLVCAKRP